jgi:hypothetical protein
VTKTSGISSHGASVYRSDLAEFYEYLGEHVCAPLPHPMPEDVLEEWRIERGDLEIDEFDQAAHEENVAAIREALQEMDAGDEGVDAREVIRQLDAELRRRMAK